MSAGIKVFAPASVANVACGFDVLGFALEGPGDDIIVKPGTAKSLQITKITGDNNQLPYDLDRNTAGFAAKMLLSHLDALDVPIDLEIHKKMPFGSGLGSSAASAAGAVMAINEFLGRPLEKKELLPFAVLGEQVADGAYHADNVAPALLGGLILIRDNTELDFYRIPVPEGLIVLVLYPHIKILTKEARSIIAKQVALDLMVKQTGNLAGLITGMFTSNFTLIGRSLVDHVIEPQRKKLVPYFDEMQQIATEHRALGCSISGAGPSIFAMFNSTVQIEHCAKEMESMLISHGIASDHYISSINMCGTTKY